MFPKITINFLIRVSFVAVIRILFIIHLQHPGYDVTTQCEMDFHKIDSEIKTDTVTEIESEMTRPIARPAATD